MAVSLAVLPLLAAAEPASRPAGSQELTAAEYHAGLKTLRGYFEKRGEDPEAAERFIAVMATALPSADGRRVPVTHDVFAAFLRYEAAWTRKTRDSKNGNVSPAQHREEVERAAKLKEAFRLAANESSPVFYRVFQAAVREVRRAPRRDGKGYAGSSAVFFSDQVDDSYSHVDAGDVALENGDTAGAIAEADKALAINPGNADAFVLRAGAEYDRRDYDAAVKDAQSALLLDPGNPQAAAIVSLSGTDAGRAALSNAVSGGIALGDDGRRAGLPVLSGTTGEETASVSGGAMIPVRLSGLSPATARPPSATPAVGALLSAELTSRAVGAAGTDARGSIDQLGQAISLNPRNAAARSWRMAMLNKIGDYPSARASAELTLAGKPDDASAYFYKAYALAGEGDKAGMVEALTQAARIDPAYQPVLDKTMQVPSTQDMELVFNDWAASHEPDVPASRHTRYPHSLLMLGAVGFALSVLGGMQLFRRGR